MPIYEYHCKHCGYKFEKLQGFSADSKCTCPKCQQPADRIISLSTFVLKGSGWYVTEHPSKDRQKALRKSGNTADSSKSTSTSETKTTEPKAEKKPVAAAAKAD